MGQSGCLLRFVNWGWFKVKCSCSWSICNCRSCLQQRDWERRPDPFQTLSVDVCAGLNTYNSGSKDDSPICQMEVHQNSRPAVSFFLSLAFLAIALTRCTWNTRVCIDTLHVNHKCVCYFHHVRTSRSDTDSSIRMLHPKHLRALTRISFNQMRWRTSISVR